MKKSEKEELKNRSVADLKIALETLQRDLFSTRLHAATQSVENTSQYKKMKRNIARALTYLREKQQRVD